MIEFGKTLRIARETKGLTVEQIAEQTHMAAKTIRELEAEDFSNITAPIYGRGFVKLYCQTVGLEPKPLVDEFMEIYNGNRDLTIHERQVEEEPPAVEASPSPVTTDAETAALQEDFSPTPPPPQMALPIGEDAPASPSRYAPPMPEDYPSSSILPAILRITILVVVVGLVIWGVVVGLKALYRSTNETEPETVATVTTSESKETPKTSAKAETKTDAKTAPAKSNRQPQKIPPLYID